MPSSRRNYLAGIGTGFSTIVAGCYNKSRSTKQLVGSDWTQIGHDARHTGANASLSGIARGDAHWLTDLESNFEISGVTVVDDRIVVGGRRNLENGFLALLSLTGGGLQRTFELPTPVVAPPVLSDSSIIATCRTDSRTGRFRAFDYEGNEQWSHRLAGSIPVPPTIFDSTVYGGDQDGAIFALGESDGNVRWERTIGDERVGGAVSAPPTVDETGVYVPVSSSAARGVYSLSPTDGTTQWKIEGPRIQSVMARTGELLVTSYPQYDVAAFDIHTGERRWSASLTERDVSPPAVSEHVIVVADNTTLYGLESETGEGRWAVACNPDPSRQPVIAGDVVIAQSENGLVGCSLTDGEQLWTIDRTSRIPIVPVENGIVFSPENNALAAYSSYQD